MNACARWRESGLGRPTSKVQCCAERGGGVGGPEPGFASGSPEASLRPECCPGSPGTRRDVLRELGLLLVSLMLSSCIELGREKRSEGIMSAKNHAVRNKEVCNIDLGRSGARVRQPDAEDTLKPRQESCGVKMSRFPV